MTNDRTSDAMRAGWALIALCVAACSSNGGDGASSGSHWLACTDASACVNHPDAVACTDGFCVDAAGSKVEGDFAVCSGDADCAGMANAMSCGADGFCVDAAGGRIVHLIPDGAAGSGTSGTGASGSGGSGGAAGGASGTGASGSGGSGGSGSGGSGGAGTGGGECPPGTAIPLSCRICMDGSCGAPSCDANGFVGFVCPEDGTAGSGGSVDAGVGVDAGGYQPCAGKMCGDYCTICDPNDTGCAETAVIKTCDDQGQCMAGNATCDNPQSCDLQADTCPSGEVCCAVGRCGPVVRDQGICEPEDPSTGDCMVCACEMQPGGCPICNSPDTPILTPDGERAIAELREGDLVMSVHEGEVVAVPVLAVRQVRVFDHAVVRLSFDNGTSIEVSGSHPTADGRRLDALAPGDALGDVSVLAVELVPYTHERTHDILPASDSGTYFAGGALLGSTLY